MVIKVENLILNSQITLNGKRTVLSIYLNVLKVSVNLCFKFCSVSLFTIYNYYHFKYIIVNVIILQVKNLLQN